MLKYEDHDRRTRSHRTARHPAGARPLELGAFLLNWIWGIGNNTYIALLTFVPIVGFVMPFVLGAKGSRWAWRNGRWDSVEHFKRVQRQWAIWGAVILIGFLLLFAGLFGGIFYGFKHAAAYELGAEKLRASAVAVSVLGTPITTGFPFGNISVNGGSGNAVFNFSATGPKASGRVFLGGGQEGRCVVDQETDAQARWEQAGD